VRGDVALVTQQAWIQNATLKDNILYGSEYDHERCGRKTNSTANNLKDERASTNTDWARAGTKKSCAAVSLPPTLPCCLPAT
jgi:tRNA isopentenyl-2-thiomethyl-A-37 hydroxylase MiaE